jgi:hypothetical protein
VIPFTLEPTLERQLPMALRTTWHLPGPPMLPTTWWRPAWRVLVDLVGSTHVPLPVAAAATIAAALTLSIGLVCTTVLARAHRGHPAPSCGPAGTTTGAAPTPSMPGRSW